MSARRWEDIESAPPTVHERPTLREDLTDFQRWAREAANAPEGAIRPYVRRRHEQEPERAPMSKVGPMRPRISSSGLFHALRVRS